MNLYWIELGQVVFQRSIFVGNKQWILLSTDIKPIVKHSVVNLSVQNIDNLVLIEGCNLVNNQGCNTYS